MKLDRNSTKTKRGKYALIKLRETGILKEKKGVATVIESAIDRGDHPETAFFVIRLRDKFASPALMSYAEAVMREAERRNDNDLMEYAGEICELARIAAMHPNKKLPD